MLHIRRTLAPTRDAVRKIVDNRIELDDGELFPRDVEIAFGSAFDKLLRASEGLDSARDSLAGIRDYLQGKIANDQNEVMKRLTMVASLLLVPTFIVGLYGQNFHAHPRARLGVRATGGRGAGSSAPPSASSSSSGGRSGSSASGVTTLAHVSESRFSFRHRRGLHDVPR